jgi:hypothetical protein
VEENHFLQSRKTADEELVKIVAPEFRGFIAKPFIRKLFLELGKDCRREEHSRFWEGTPVLRQVQVVHRIRGDKRLHGSKGRKLSDERLTEWAGGVQP